MSVFLIWSGEASRQIALGLRETLPLILHNAAPFMSEEDVRTGQQWFSTIGTALQSATFGVVCLTKDNMTAPWINFEAGAIAHRVATNRVAAILLGMEKSDVGDPLRQFQHSSTSKEETSRLIWSMNESLPEPSRLDRTRYDKIFDAFWPDIEKIYDRATKTLGESRGPTQSRAKTIEPDSTAQELLDLSRSTARSLSAIAVGMQQLAFRFGEISARGVDARSLGSAGIWSANSALWSLETPLYNTGYFGSGKAPPPPRVGPTAVNNPSPNSPPTVVVPGGSTDTNKPK